MRKNALLKQLLFLVVFINTLLSCFNKTWGSENVITGENLDARDITLTGVPHTFPIELNSDEIIAEATVYIDIDHPDPKELKVELFPYFPTSFTLHNEGQPGYPNATGGLKGSYDYPIKPYQDIKKLAGARVSGNGPNTNQWLLRITDEKTGNTGRYNSWRLELATAQTANINILFATYSINLLVDGYGSFGDQNYGTAAGAIYQPTTAVPASQTVFQSSLFLHNKNRFLSSSDMYPGNRYPSVQIEKDSNGELKSAFEIDDFSVELRQKIVETGNNSFTLLQIYDFFAKSTNSNNLQVSRYLNARLSSQNDELGLKNYSARRILESSDRYSLYSFNQISSATTETSTYVEISSLSDTSDLIGYQFRPYSSGGKEFPTSLVEEDLNIYNRTSIVPGDLNNDFVTDPGQGDDYVMLLGSQLRFDSSNHARYVAITQWGYDSPAAIFSVTEEQQIIDLPPAMQPSPLPTQVPTARPTQTPVSGKPQWVKKIPDLRFLVNEAVPAVLDLDDYVYDPDTPSSDLEWKIDSHGIPFNITTEHVLSVNAITNTGDYGNIRFTVSDGMETIGQDVRVKVSTVLLQQFYLPEPIILNRNEQYNSSFRLDDYIHTKLGEAGVIWTRLGNVPEGIKSAAIQADSGILLEADEITRLSPQNLLYKVSRGEREFTPTPSLTPTFTVTNTSTPTPTATFTNTPTLTHTTAPLPTNTPTPLPTATFTPQVVPTSTSTNSPTPSRTSSPTNTLTSTATSTETNTPTATRTPTPSSTLIIPSVTPSPTATPTLGCSLAFQFSPLPGIGTGTGPYDLSHQSDENGPTLTLAHLDDGTIRRYRLEQSAVTLTQTVASKPGITNLVQLQINQDTVPDFVVLNGYEEELEILLSSPSGSYQSAGIFDLDESGLVDVNDSFNGIRYRALALVESGTQSSLLCVRVRTALLLLRASASGLQLVKRVEVNGQIRFLHGFDMDNDGTQELFAAVRTPSEEQIQIFKYQNNDLELIDIHRTDYDFTGNQPIEFMFNDFNGDGRTDLAALLFSNGIRFYANQATGSFTEYNEVRPFPPGLITAIASADFDGNGRLDLAALQENQNGLSLYLVCGNNPQQFTELKSVLISPSVVRGQQYTLLVTDADQDQDEDILFTQSLLDSLILVKNLRNP